MTLLGKSQTDPNEIGTVGLSAVSVEAEGHYKCEVSCEGPNFFTDFDKAYMAVHGEPYDTCFSHFRRRAHHTHTHTHPHTPTKSLLASWRESADAPKLVDQVWPTANRLRWMAPSN